MERSILGVEHELVTQRLIAARLERAGYKVTRAHSLGVVPRLGENLFEPTHMQAAGFEYYSAPIANGRIAALNSTRLKQCW